MPWWPGFALPPLEAGAVHDTVADVRLVLVPTTPVGASGTVATRVIAVLATLAVLSPTAFVATTLNVYWFQLVSPVMVAPEVLATVDSSVLVVTLYGITL